MPLKLPWSPQHAPLALPDPLVTMAYTAPVVTYATTGALTQARLYNRR